MSRPTTLLLRVDSMVYARSVYVFKRDERRLYWMDYASVMCSQYSTVNNTNPQVVRHIKMKEVV